MRMTTAGINLKWTKEAQGGHAQGPPPGLMNPHPEEWQADRSRRRRWDLRHLDENFITGGEEVMRIGEESAKRTGCQEQWPGRVVSDVRASLPSLPSVAAGCTRSHLSAPQLTLNNMEVWGANPHLQLKIHV